MSHPAKLWVLSGLGFVSTGTAAAVAATSLTSHSTVEIPNDDWVNDKEVVGSENVDRKIKGYQAIDPGPYLTSANLGWQEDELDSYPKESIAYNLKRWSNSRLISKNAAPEVWASMSISVLNDHHDSENNDLDKYSPEFVLILKNMKHNWRKWEELKNTWGEWLQKVCAANYRNVDASTVLQGVISLCTMPK